MGIAINKNNQRIAKNMLLLYFRMFLVMGVTLYTSRIVLQVLGVVDFGIFNIIGGVVAMMGILNSAMVAATNRFLSFELGSGNEKQLKKVFSMSLNIYILFSLLFVIIAETIGIWFVNSQLVIPENRVYAANMVYQYSILSCVITFIMTPFNAAIIAHEQMEIYAYVSIAEVLLKLCIVFLLEILPFDKLSTYGFLVMIVSMAIAIIYCTYSIIKYKECRLKLYWNQHLFKTLLTYSGWNLFGSLASLFKGNGLNILLNIFFNPAINAARGISFQVNNAVGQFCSNFYLAVKPQIIKYYAQKDLYNMFNLMIRSSKLSAFLLVALSMPLIIDTPYIINLWLGQSPEYTIPFTRLMLAITIIEGMANPLMTACHATGRVALYQSIVGILILLNIPVSYFFLKMGFSPLVVYIISLIIEIIAFYTRLFIVKYLIPTFPIKKYNMESIMRVLIVVIFASILPIIFHFYYQGTFLYMITTIIICELSIAITAYTIGLKKEEQLKVNHIITTTIRKYFK